MVHRDIKPSTVAIVSDAASGEVRPVLLDFGAAVLGEVIDVAEVAPTLPRPFAAVLRLALAPDASLRFASKEAFAAALRRSLAASDVLPSRGPIGSARRVDLIALALVIVSSGVAVASRTRQAPSAVATVVPATRASKLGALVR